MGFPGHATPKNITAHLSKNWQRPEILSAVFDQLSDALFLYDKNLRIVGVNQAAERLFGMAADSMVGKPCQEVFRCPTCEPSCAILQGIGEASCLPSGTVNLRMANGLERLVV